jgi:L-ascorbate metabolism protein UlaG (beta-lactamase superfamily)
MMIKTDKNHIFFGGDSGYCDYPKQIATLFPSIDVAMIGVGAYTPDYMMHDVHTNPIEAVQIIHDLKAANFIPMHYGTYDLADEPMGEPERMLVSLNSNSKISANLLISSVGETLRIK